MPKGRAKGQGLISLFVCMGFGCNAVGVTGCRIIDSRRERLIAMITNAFVPCNGRFPILIAMVSIFLVSRGGFVGGIWSALVIMALILVSIIATFGASKLLSRTFLRGEPSAFTLELPPYRTPKVWQVIVRSVFDRTLFVLGRAVAIAAPAGLVLWLLANIAVGDTTLLVAVSDSLNGVGAFFGMDGAILLGFILALPANEIAIPIMLMIYTRGGALVEYASLSELHHLLTSNGWTMTTAICVSLFTIFHFPCSTTLLTIKKESGKWRWAVLAAVLPTVIGLALCFSVRIISDLIGNLL